MGTIEKTVRRSIRNPNILYLMIIYGWNHFRLKSFDTAEFGLTQQADPNVKIEVRQRYFHLFWIPFFGIGKTWAVRRDNKLYEVSEELKSIIKSRSDLKFRTPWYTFIGPLILVAIWIGYVISEKLEENRTAQYQKEQVIVDYAKNIDFFRKPSPDDIYQFVSVKDYDLKYAKITGIDKQHIELALITNSSAYAFKSDQIEELFQTYADEVKTISVNRNDSAKLFCNSLDALESFTGFSLDDKYGRTYRVKKIIRLDKSL